MPQIRFTPEKPVSRQIRFTADQPEPQPVPAASPTTSTPAPTPRPTFGDYVKAAGLGLTDPFAGIGSGVFSTALGASHLINRLTGGRAGVPSGVTLADIGMEPTNAVQRLGMAGEQAGEFMLPGGAIEHGAAMIPTATRLGRLANLGTRAALEGASAAGIAGLQGGDPTLTGSIAAATPLTGALAGSTARSLYRSMLKPSTTLAPEEAAALAETGLREGIPVNRRGLGRLENIAERLNQRVRSYLDPNVTIQPSDVVRRAEQTRPRLELQATPQEELAAFDARTREFLGQHQIPGQAAVPPQQFGPLTIAGTPAVPAQDIPIPSPLAQKLKTGTYQRTYARTGEQGLTAASKMGQTALARGLKEELESKFPQIGPLNQQLEQLYALRNELTPAINRIENRDIMPLAGYLNPLALLERFPAKSRLAIMLEGMRSPLAKAAALGTTSQLTR